MATRCQRSANSDGPVKPSSDHLLHTHKNWVTFYSTPASCVGSILKILPAWMTGGPSGPCRLSLRVLSFV